MATGPQFTKPFGAYACEGDSIETEFNGVWFVATIHSDSDRGAPWDNDCGHGPVMAGWEGRDKRPGELILSEDYGRKRFYDFKEACKIARRDGWGFLPAPLKTWQDGDYWFAACEGVNQDRPLRGDDINAAIRAAYASYKATMSPREYAARAAMRDFKILKAWCDDKWRYCGIAVQAFAGDIELTDEYGAALWGIELNYPDSDNAYLLEVANELVDECLDAAKAALAEKRDALAEINL